MGEHAVIHYFFPTLKKNNEACIRLKSLFVMEKTPFTCKEKESGSIGGLCYSVSGKLSL